jgi:hypothetical protein
MAISGMQAGDPLPPHALFQGGVDLTPRLGIDVLIDRNTGLLRTDRGISLFADPATVERFGGAYRVESIPEGLKIQQRGRDPGHYELMPPEPISFERYVELLQQAVKSERPCFTEPGLIIVLEVTVQAIQDAVQFVWKQGFFASLKAEQGVGSMTTAPTLTRPLVVQRQPLPRSGWFLFGRWSQSSGSARGLGSCLDPSVWAQGTRACTTH